MSPSVWILVPLILIAVAAIGAGPLLRSARRRELRRGVRLFRIRREALEARFIDMASRLGKPRGLIWKECDWQEPVTFARDLESGLLTAFVGVEIHFEAVPGGDMEGVEAVSTIRDASALFHYRNGQWGTGGKALFNMNPADAIERLAGQFEPLDRG